MDNLHETNLAFKENPIFLTPKIDATEAQYFHKLTEHELNLTWHLTATNLRLKGKTASIEIEAPKATHGYELIVPFDTTMKGVITCQGKQILLVQSLEGLRTVAYKLTLEPADGSCIDLDTPFMLEVNIVMPRKNSQLPASHSQYGNHEYETLTRKPQIK